MKVLFSTGSLGHLPVRDVFELAREAGFDGCDLVVGKAFGDARYIETVRECAQILPVFSMHAPYVHIPNWGNQIETLLRSIDMGKTLGAQILNFHPPSWLAREVRFYRWFRKIRDFQMELRCEPLRLTIENMPLIKLILPPYVLNNFQRLIAFGVERNLHFTFDITHLGTYGYDTIKAFIRYLETGRLRNMHISDYSLWREKEHLGIGRGELQIVRLLNTMRRLGYDEMVTLEISPHELPRTREWLLKVMSYSAAFLRLHLDSPGKD
jgi:sugar phosphate isomerase/epimerase